VNDLGWLDAIGKSVTMYDTTRLTIIGVVKDFYTSGLWNKIEPTMLRISDADNFGLLIIRGNPADLAGILEFMRMSWKRLAINEVFGGRLQEDTMQEEKDINGSILKVNLFLAVVATLLSLIGMYNLVSLDIIRRTKEIGIRKIQGASVPLLMFLVSKKFLIVLMIAAVIGSLGGYYLSLMLLDSIWDYFVTIGAGMLLSAVLIMTVATVLTIIFKVFGAVMRNPADSLRYE
jgi:putative ABC transport system permease protein